MPRPRLIFLLAALLFAAPASPAAASPAAVRAPERPDAALARILDLGKWSRPNVLAAKRLVRRGAGLRTRSPRRGITVLMLAARTGDAPLARAALRAGVDVNARTTDGQDLTALWFAVGSRSADTLRLLLRAGAEVDARDAYGRTPLMLATSFKFREGIELLLRRGAKIDARNKKGATALAYTDGHSGITSLLRHHGLAD